MQTFTGLEYILIDIANQFGLDKLTWNERITWARGHVNSTPELQQEDIIMADEPLLMQKAIYAYQDAIAGVPTGFIMGLDATASGQQISAALAGCHKTARRVNLINTGKREDVYGFTANRMDSMCPDLTVTRDSIKYPLMTRFYNSTKQPENIFGEDTHELAMFYKTLYDELPGAMEVLNDQQGCWNPTALFHSWSLPDGHVAHVKVMQTVDRKIEVDELGGATFTHRMQVNKCVKMGLSLPANINHSIDGYIVREMVRRAAAQGFELVTVHDEFKAGPNHMNKVRQNYIDIMVEIAESNLLQDILNEICGTNHKLTKLSTTLAVLIKDSEYMLS